MEIGTSQTPENIINTLQATGITAQDDIVLIGGSPKMRALFAVTFSDGMADKLIPLTSAGIVLTPDANVASESQSTNTKLSAGTSYSFGEIAQLMSNITIVEGSTGDSAGYNSTSGIIWPEFTFAAGFALLLYCCYKIKLCMKKQKAI